MIARQLREEPQPAGEILIVEDDPGLRHLIAESLEFIGYRATAARDGADALRVLARVTPQVVLLDIRMPVMRGQEFALEVKRRQIPTRIIVMTASPEVEDIAREVGADGYLMKPFPMSELLRLVEQQMNDSAR